MEKAEVRAAREEKESEEKNKDLGARKGRQSKSRLAAAVGAKPSCQIRDQKLHAAVPRSRFRS